MYNNINANIYIPTHLDITFSKEKEKQYEKDVTTGWYKWICSEYTYKWIYFSKAQQHI